MAAELGRERQAKTQLDLRALQVGGVDQDRRRPEVSLGEETAVVDLPGELDRVTKICERLVEIAGEVGAKRGEHEADLDPQVRIPKASRYLFRRRQPLGRTGGTSLALIDVAEQEQRFAFDRVGSSRRRLLDDPDELLGGLLQLTEHHHRVTAPQRQLEAALRVFVADD